MSNKRHKYTAVINPDEFETESEEMKRKVCSPVCLWTSLFTTVLIGAYYIPSIGLTFYQRWLYQSFHFPLTTVLVHMTVKYVLAALIRIMFVKRQGKQRILLGWKEYILTVAPTGIFSGIDIGFSNWGLELIKVSLYTMTKSTTIVFILFFSILFKLEKKSWSLCGIVMMITIGLMLFTYKSTQFDFLGFILLLLASASSGVRWTCVQLLLQKPKMGMKNPVDMIYHMQPWMIASVLPFAVWMEELHNPNRIMSKDNLLAVTQVTLKLIPSLQTAGLIDLSTNLSPEITTDNKSPHDVTQGTGTKI
ncbi:hypothetical protein NQ317_000497 [Molorchus minor]|uniref:Sugar phosphate transporter domain-containing protein n=1 Tax=Molorchus minor TaxID=1323400 RepID=A0ABQ9JAW7_9CUCU|nr:hypothetical protein NQ317_000497 [Molorchus minor]